jgi:hypothetical protein
VSLFQCENGFACDDEPLDLTSTRIGIVSGQYQDGIGIVCGAGFRRRCFAAGGQRTHSLGVLSAVSPFASKDGIRRGWPEASLSPSCLYAYTKLLTGYIPLVALRWVCEPGFRLTEVVLIPRCA